MTIRDSILGLTAYPVPLRTIEGFAIRRGVDLNGDATKDLLESPAYMLLTADVYSWLVISPNIGQGGQSYSFADRMVMKSKARSIYEKCGDEADKASLGTRYGYMGCKL